MYSFYPNSTLRWSSSIPELKSASDIVIGNEGLLFVANLNEVFFYLIGISTINGSIIWEVQSPDALQYPDTIAYGSGLVILGSSCGQSQWCANPRLIAFNVLDGSVKWVSDVIKNTFQFIYIVADDQRGVIYSVSYTLSSYGYNTISAVDGVTGKLKWSYNASTSYEIGEIAITSTGDLIYTYLDINDFPHFSKISPAGVPYWITAPQPCAIGGSSSAAVDQYHKDVSYFSCGTYNESVSAYDTNGNLAWRFSANVLGYLQSPAIRKSDGALFVRVFFNQTYYFPSIWAIDTTGKAKWKYKIDTTSQYDEGQPLIVGENFIYTFTTNPAVQVGFFVFGIPVPTWN